MEEVATKLHAMHAVDPRKRAEVVKAVVAPRRQRRRVPHVIVSARKTDCRIANLAQIVCYALQAGLGCEIHAAVVALLATRYAQITEAEFVNQAWIEDVRVIERDVARSGCDVVAESRDQRLIQGRAAIRLKRPHVRISEARKEIVLGPEG